jgi:hypothetical protein
VPLPVLRAHRSARLRTSAAGCRADGELRIPCESLTTCCTAITEISAQRAESSSKFGITEHEANAGLAQGDAIEQQPNVGCFSIRAILSETIHERQLTRGLTILAQVDAVLHLRAQLNASTLLHGLFSFQEQMVSATRHEPVPRAPLVIPPHRGQQAGLLGSRMRLTWL